MYMGFTERVLVRLRSLELNNSKNIGIRDLQDASKIRFVLNFKDHKASL